MESIAMSLLNDLDPRKRLEGLRTIVKTAKKLPWEDRAAIVKGLAPLLTDPQPFVLWNLAIGLGQIGHPEALPLLGKLSAHPHANVRFRAALAIAFIGEETGLEVLEKLSQDEYKIGEHYLVRAFAVLALGQLGNLKGVPILSKLAEETDPVVRWHAVVALGDMGDLKAAPVLLKRLEDAVPFVRGHAAIALAEIGTTGHVADLERAAERETHEKMKGVIASALKLLKGISSD